MSKRHNRKASKANARLTNSHERFESWAEAPVELNLVANLTFLAVVALVVAAVVYALTLKGV